MTRSWTFGGVPKRARGAVRTITPVSRSLCTRLASRTGSSHGFRRRRLRHRPASPGPKPTDLGVQECHQRRHLGLLGAELLSLFGQGRKQMLATSGTAFADEHPDVVERHADRLSCPNRTDDSQILFREIHIRSRTARTTVRRSQQTRTHVEPNRRYRNAGGFRKRRDPHTSPSSLDCEPDSRVITHEPPARRQARRRNPRSWRTRFPFCCCRAC